MSARDIVRLVAEHCPSKVADVQCALSVMRPPGARIMAWEEVCVALLQKLATPPTSRE